MKKNLRGIFLGLLIGAAALARVPISRGEATKSPASPSVAPEESLSQALDRAVSKLKAGGAVAGESDHGAIHYFSAGNLGRAPGIPPEKVIFEIGSITKVFTSLLLAQAVVEHKVALEDPISRYLPKSLAMDPAVAAITLEQLATHTSGLPRMPDNFRPKDPLDPYADYTVENLYAFLQNYRFKTPPAEYPNVDYSNVGVGLLGHILELVYRQPYGDLIAAKISGPLGLPDTVVNLDEEQQARFAVPHAGSMAVKPWHLPTLAGAGALHSTAADLIRFADTLMTPEKDPLRESWDIVRNPRHDAVGQKIGLIVMIQKRDRDVVYWHNGGTGGFRTYLEWSPQPSKRVLVILASNGEANPDGVAASLASPKPANPPGNMPEAVMPLPAGKAQDFVGVYAINASARFTFLTDPSGRLEGRLTGQGFAPLLYSGNDRFFAKASRAVFQFSRAPDGQVNGVTLLQNGTEIKAKQTGEPAPTVMFLPADKLKDYVGRYSLQPGVEFEVTLRKTGCLFVKLASQPFLPVFPDRPDHFVYDVVEAALTFERGPDGAVTALVIHQNGQDLRAERVAPVEPKLPAPVEK